MLGTIPTAIKAMCQLTAQVGPVFKGGGAANYGFAGVPVRNAAGDYTHTTDGNTNLVATANATVTPDYCIVTPLSNPGAANGFVPHYLISAINTLRTQTTQGAALADVDFALIILGIR